MTTFDAAPPFPTRRGEALLAHPKTAFALVVALTAVAYNHSLRSLGEYLSSDTPIAYVAMVPMLVLALAVVRSAPRADERRLPHRHADWLLGLPLLAGAAVVGLVLPGRLNYAIWTNRLDLLGLPLFVAGLIAIAFGARMLRRVALPLVLLLLVWPFPYERFLTDLLSGSQQLVLWALEPIGRNLPGVDALGNATFRLGTGPEAFEVNVAPACAGASTGLGFLLIGGFGLLAVDGSKKRKLGWLVTGVVLTQLVNLGRLVALFLTGANLGRDVALDWLHPYFGLVLFLVTSVVMFTFALPRFGLSLRDQPPVGDPETATQVTALTPARRRLTLSALAVVCSLALVLGMANSSLARFDAFSGIGDADTAPSLIERITPAAGITARRYGTVDWIGQYFGKSARWTRYYATVPKTPGQVFLDVQQVSDLGAFERFGLESCYRFHGREIIENDRIDVGWVIPAQTMIYVDTKDRADRTWSLVSWVWPVTQNGERRFERIVLLRPVSGTDAAAVAKAQDARDSLLTAARSMVTAAAR